MATTLNFREQVIKETDSVTLSATVTKYQTVTWAGAVGTAGSVGEDIMGIALEDGDSGDVISVATLTPANTITVIVAPSQTITVGMPLTAAADGKVEEAVTTEYIIGYAKNAATTGAGDTEYIPMQLQFGYKK